MADYRVITVDLTTARTPNDAPIVERNVEIFSVTVLRMPAGSAASLHFGPRQGIPLSEGVEFSDPTGCVIEDQGIFMSHAAQSGVTLDLYVGFSGAVAERA